MEKKNVSIKNTNQSTSKSCFCFPNTGEDFNENHASILTEISSPLSTVPRLQGKTYKASVNGRLSVASLLSNAYAQSGFPITSCAILQSGQMGLTFYQIDLISKRVALVISSIVAGPGYDYQVCANGDGDSVILIINDGDHVDEQLIVLIYAILRLGATYMVVRQEDLVTDIRGWRQMLDLIEPVLVISVIDAIDLSVPIRDELHLLSREHFLDADDEDLDINSNFAEPLSPTGADIGDGRASESTFTSDNGTTSTISLIKKLRSLLVLKNALRKPVTVSLKVVWDLALDVKVIEQQLQVIHFKSDTNLGQRAAFIFQCEDASGRSQWCRLGHRAVRNRIIWERLEFPMKTGEKCCLTFPLQDPRSLVQIFHSFIHGRALVIGDREDFTNKEFLLRKLDKETNIHRLELTPERLQSLLDVALESSMESVLWKVQIWFVSGSHFPPSLARKFFQVVSKTDAALVPMYGKAELIWSASWDLFTDLSEVNKWTMEKGTKLTMGIPITNTNIYILDERKFRCCHYGQKGEICIAGSMLATNVYCGSPATGGKSAALFQTGDLGRIVQDRLGNKKLLVDNSLDSRVMLKGKLIDLDDLTSQIKKTPMVKDAYAFLVSRGRDTPVVVVALSSIDSRRLTRLKKTVFSIEPLISTCFHINSIPVYPGGKVDLKQLRASYFKFLGSCGPRQWDAIMTPNKHSRGKSRSGGSGKNIQVVCKAVAFSLGLSVSDVIDRYEENFWDIGGTPLRAIMTVKSCLCQGKRLCMEDFVLANNICDLVARLTLSVKDEVKWNQGIYLAKKSFIYSKLTKTDLKEMNDILVWNVSQMLEAKEVDKYVTSLLKAFDNDLSAVALKADTMEVIGLALNYKGTLKSHYMPSKIEEAIELFNAILLSARHLTKGIENKSIAKSYVISLKMTSLAPSQTVLVTRDLISESVKNAALAGCKGYILSTVDSLVQEICCSLLGFEVLEEVQLNLYKNKRLQKPFLHLDDHQIGGAYFKRL